MYIKEIIKVGSNVTLYFDNNKSIKINYYIFLESHLGLDDKVSQNLIDDLLFKNEVLKVKNSALNYLTRRAHSNLEIYQKLVKKDYEKKHILKAIEELSKLNYLDDSKFAQMYIDEKIRIGRYGLNKIIAELMKKGIDRSIIDEFSRKYKNDKNLNSSLNKLAQKRFNILKEKNLEKQKIKAKLFSHLANKGFNSSEIWNVINKLLVE